MPAAPHALIAKCLLPWFKKHGRHDLPWQNIGDPWKVWVSEIMLQQTQVRTVRSYFANFIQRFPKPQSLADASMDEVLYLWSGLGYYARARNLKRAAEIVAVRHAGQVPRDIEELMALPGIGRSTAGAILSLACGQSHPILDGNVRRVLSRCFAVAGTPGKKETERMLWALAVAGTPRQKTAEYNQAIMDLGASVCTPRKPQCESCPLCSDCIAYAEGSQLAYPARRRRAALPVKQALYLLLENSEGEILLERQPPAGLWGGLWCPPKCPLGKDPDEWTRDVLGLQPEGFTEIAVFRHAFSHYYLDIRTLCAKVGEEHVPQLARETCLRVWHTRYSRRGLPAPIQDLLERVWQT
ncbi:MAG: A/G-specific adenine glycosylase [Candidatus Eutrophobiaceae bacterium]